MKSKLLSTRPEAFSSHSRIVAASEPSELKVLSNKNGSVVFGWADHSVFFSRFQGRITAQTGYSYATRLSELVASTQTLCFFCDSSELKCYDMLARSAFARVVLSNRKKFESITLLTRTEDLSPATPVLLATLGEAVEELNNRHSFEARLRHKAPLESSSRKIGSGSPSQLL